MSQQSLRSATSQQRPPPALISRRHAPTWLRLSQTRAMIPRAIQEWLVIGRLLDRYTALAPRRFRDFWISELNPLRRHLRSISAGGIGRRHVARAPRMSVPWAHVVCFCDCLRAQFSLVFTSGTSIVQTSPSGAKSRLRVAPGIAPSIRTLPNPPALGR
jgi:hypothetical protein